MIGKTFIGFQFHKMKEAARRHLRANNCLHLPEVGAVKLLFSYYDNGGRSYCRLAIELRVRLDVWNGRAS